MSPVVVRILVCGLCVIEDMSELFRTADSPSGRRQMKRHVIEEHRVVNVNGGANPSDI